MLKLEQTTVDGKTLSENMNMVIKTKAENCCSNLQQKGVVYMHKLCQLKESRKGT